MWNNILALIFYILSGKDNKSFETLLILSRYLTEKRRKSEKNKTKSSFKAIFQEKMREK